jgi:hypothetical protein
MVTGTVIIGHDGEGRGHVDATLTGCFYQNAPLVCSGGWDVPDIPRASAFSLVGNPVGIGDKQTVTISRASDRFTHVVEWEIAGKTWTQTEVGTSAEWTVPVEVGGLVANVGSVLCHVRVTTMVDGREVGSRTGQFWVVVPVTWVPVFTVTASRVDGPVPVKWGVAVQHHSKATISVSSAKPGMGASLKSWRITGPGVDVTGEFGDKQTVASHTTVNPVEVAGTVDWSVTVTDSRGRSVSKTAPMVVTEWAPPQVVPGAVYRADAKGVQVGDGGWVSVLADYGFASVDGKNTVTAKVEYQPSGSTTWVNGGPIASGRRQLVGEGKLSAGSSYLVRLTVRDTLGGEASTTWQVGTGQVDVEFRADGNGMGVGGVGETSGAVDVRWPIRQRQSPWVQELGDSEDLNELRRKSDNPTWYHQSVWYHQSQNARTSWDRHYPVLKAGMLHVTSTGSPMFTYQWYHCYDGSGVWHRVWYSKWWSPWRRVLHDAAVATMNGAWMEEYLIDQDRMVDKTRVTDRRRRWTQLVGVDTTLSNRLYGDFAWFADLKLPAKPAGATIDSVHVSLNAQQSGDIAFATAKPVTDWSFFILGFPAAAKILGTVEVTAYGTKP